jgi:hypothetical protein
MVQRKDRFAMLARALVAAALTLLAACNSHTAVTPARTLVDPPAEDSNLPVVVVTAPRYRGSPATVRKAPTAKSAPDRSG